MANRSEVLTTAMSYIAEDAIIKNGWVKQGTGAHQCAITDGAADAPLGIALDDADAGEEVSILTEGRVYVIAHTALATGANVTCGAHHKAVASANPNRVAGVVVGEDVTTLGDLILVEISSGYKPILA